MPLITLMLIGLTVGAIAVGVPTGLFTALLFMTFVAAVVTIVLD